MTTPGRSAAGIGESELQEIYAFALQLAKDAGELLMKPIHRRSAAGRRGDGDLGIQLKDSSVDIVTETDTSKRHSNGIPDILRLGGNKRKDRAELTGILMADKEV